MTHQSLYRRYRPSRFAEVKGQSHVIGALQNAIREDRVGHAYLFSGPRGTGKTTTARLLAKALNCTDLGDDGEPCGTCSSCVAFAAGNSYDLHELDAASNNKVDDIRDLISKVALGSPGRTKVYVLDEVHMLTAGAENALLKTLEEPPEHVVFVLCTTEPHKVVPTIRSRTQHFPFELLTAEALAEHVRWVVADAGLDVDDPMVDYVVRTGQGSARDTLSALDRVVAAGSIPHGAETLDALIDALVARDAGAVLVAVSSALRAGRDPRVIGEDLLAQLRNGFLTTLGAAPEQLTESEQAIAERLRALGPAALTRSLDVLGLALVEMRQAPDPRVDLEVALLRLVRPDLDAGLASILERLERLERLEHLDQGRTRPASAGEADPVAAAPADSRPAARAAGPTEKGPSGGRAGAESARAQLAAARSATSSAAPASSAGPARTAPPEAASATGPSSKAALGAYRTPPPAVTPPSVQPLLDPDPPAPAPATLASPLASMAIPQGDPVSEPVWDRVLDAVSGRARARFRAGRLVSLTAETATVALPNTIHRDRCVECTPEVEAALAERLGHPVGVELVVDTSSGPQERSSDSGSRAAEDDDHDDETVDVTELADAPPDEGDGLRALTSAFPGAEILRADEV